MEKPVTVIITDDKPQWRRSLRILLKDFGIITIAEASHGAELLQLLSSLKPDVILLDLKMPVMDGNETMRQLSIIHPQLNVIIMSYHDDRELVKNYALRGAKGFISKDDVAGNIDDLVVSIKRVLKGGKSFNVQIDEGAVKLTIRQQEIINLIADGKTKQEIAAELKLSLSGVDKQKKKIMNLFGVKNISGFYKSIYSLGLNFIGRPGKK